MHRSGIIVDFLSIITNGSEMESRVAPQMEIIM